MKWNGGETQLPVTNERLLANLTAMNGTMKSALLLFFLATLIIACEIAIYEARWVLLTAALGVGLGVIAVPLVDGLQRRVLLPRSLTALGLIVLVSGVVFFIGFSLFHLGSDQINLLSQRWPELAGQVSEMLSSLSSRYPWVAEQLGSLELRQTAPALLQNAAEGFRVGGTTIAAVGIVFVIAAYLMINPNEYFRLATRLVPRDWRPRTEKVMILIARNLRRWFFTQLIAMTAVGALTTLGLWLIGVNYWLFLGVTTGLLDIIPYIGNAVPAIAAIFVSLADSPERVPWIIALYIAVNQFENNVLLPTIMKARMNFPPVLLITLMMILGSFFGIAGMLISPAVFTILQTLGREFLARGGDGESTSRPRQQ